MEITEGQTQLKVWWRIVPLIWVLLFFCALDRFNISFAALQMNAYLGLSSTEFGKAAGAVAIGYSLFVIPSSLLIHRLGTRRGICLIMLLWGLCSAATAFVKTPNELMVVRALLGAAESGFAPAMTLYLSLWFPSEYRGRVLGSFFMMVPLVLIIGGPLSTALLSLDGLLGLAGWQWLFILEALPTLLLVPLVFFTLKDEPADAPWLSPQEKERLTDRIAAEKRQVEGSHGSHSVWRTLANRRVWLLAAVCFGVGTCVTAFNLFLPLMIRTMGFSTSQTGLIITAPALAGLVAMPLWGLLVDRSGNRIAVVAATCWVMAAGLLGAAALLPSPWALLPISVMLIGVYGYSPSFWTLPQAFLTGASAAAGMGLIIGIGHLAAFVGPTFFGWAKDLTGSYGVGLACLAAVAAVPAVIMTVQAMRNRNSINQKLAAAKPAGV